MEFVTLNAEGREETKKGACRRLRAEGKVPGVLYGRNLETKILSVSSKVLEDAMRNTRTEEYFFDLKLNGKSYNVILKNLQRNVLNGKFVHADFYNVEADRKIDVRVSLLVKGTPKGVNLGGILRIYERTVLVNCLPADVPVSLEVDVSNLAIGKTIYLKDVAVPEGVSIVSDSSNVPVATVLSSSKGSSSDEEVEGSEEELEEENDKEEDEE